ncbi:MAG: SDR family oxidoreductase [Clostridia bacterium]|nr:SDR family oxidoreductase [Clostridia bacterium]
MRFENKIALITGAAVGIGRATALCMAQQGASLALLDMDAAALQAVAEECTQLQAQAECWTCDISDENRVKQVVSAVEERFGKIDILVNNAGIWRCFTSFLDTPSETWRRYFDVNVLGTANVTRAVLPGMVKRQYGRIINVASVVGVYGKTNMAQYAASKAAIINFTQSLAREVAELGVRVNCVSPGTVSTSENSDIDFTESMEKCYMQRTGSARENADLICWLAGDESGYLSGQNILLDGCRKII